MCKTLKDLVINQTDSIDIRKCYVETGIEDILSQLDQELVGLKGVKNRVREISSVLLFSFGKFFVLESAVFALVSYNFYMGFFSFSELINSELFNIYNNVIFLASY